MKKYSPRRTAILEAVQYEGGAAKATPIINWVLENGGTARYHEAVPAWENDEGTIGSAAIDEHIYICDDVSSFKLWIGDWVMLQQEAWFSKFDNEEFTELFEPAPES